MVERDDAAIGSRSSCRFTVAGGRQRGRGAGRAVQLLDASMACPAGDEATGLGLLQLATMPSSTAVRGRSALTRAPLDRLAQD